MLKFFTHLKLQIQKNNRKYIKKKYIKKYEDIQNNHFHNFLHKQTEYSSFNFTEFQEMNRISSPILSPDGLYIIYSVRKWNSTLDKSYTNLQYIIIKSNEVKDLTPK